MKNFLKQNWFVGLVALFFVCISIWFAYDQHKNDLPTKTVNGLEVVYSVDDVNVTADEVYEDLYKSYGEYLIGKQFSDIILDTAVETTSELKAEATEYYEYYDSLYSTYYGSGYIDALAKSYGYSDGTSYFLYILKSRQIVSKYITEHSEEYITEEFLAKYNPKTISYVLIKFEDPANPTEEELARLKAAQEAWESDKYSADNFADFAIAFSEDSSTASGGGVLGYFDNETTNLVEDFKNAALKLTAGEVSEWTFSKDYGYFLIKCNSTNANDFLDDATLCSRVISYYENASNEIIWHYAQQAGTTFADEKVKAYICEQLGIEVED